MQRDLDAANEALEVLAATQADKAYRGRLLADLTRSLPDSSFLVSLRLEADGTGSLSGYAAHAAAVVAGLEHSDIIRDPSLEGATTREAVSGRELERFAMRFRLPARPGRARR